MYCLISYNLDFESCSLRYPLPNSLDLVIMDENLEISDKKRILFPDLKEQSDDALYQSWKAGLENAIEILSSAEAHILVFPTDVHLTIFHTIKRKCKLHIKTIANGFLVKHTYNDSSTCDETPLESIPIEKMIAYVSGIGAQRLANHPDIFPSNIKRDKAKIAIAARKEYRYIGDTTNRMYHKKDCLCLDMIPTEFWRGLGTRSYKYGYSPCPECISNSDYVKSPMLFQATHKQLINGHYALNENAIARCSIPYHTGFLTRDIVKSHGCIAKECVYFEKTDRLYWSARKMQGDTTESDRLNRLNGKTLGDDPHMFIKDVLEDSGCVHVKKILESNDMVGISYIYDRKVDLTLEIRFLQKELGKNVKLRALIGSSEEIEQYIRKPRREMRKVKDIRIAPQVGNATKKRLAVLGVFCLEDLYGRDGDQLYELDCKLSGSTVNRRFLTIYRNAVEFANNIEI